jgi:prephenate dehydrogenase
MWCTPRARAARQIGSFVPAHPITGKEVAGVEHADVHLYRKPRSC